MTQPASLRALEHHDGFIERHIGPNDAEVSPGIAEDVYPTDDAMTDAIDPANI